MSYHAFEIFSKLNGSRPTRISTSEIKKGWDNKGIFLHEIEEPSDGELKARKIIQKITARPKEIEVLDSLGEFKKFVHQIYLIRKDEVGCHVYMEYLKIRNRIKEEDYRKIEKQLVKRIYEFNTSKVSKFRRATTYAKNYIKSIKEKSSFFGLDLTDFIRNEKKIKSEIGGLPVFMSHNDIKWNNLGKRPGDGELLFLDLGMMGFNVAGSELHFFSECLKDSQFESLTRKYSKLSNLEHKKIKLSALLHACYREINRAYRFLNDESKSSSLKRQLSFMEKNLGKISDLLKN